MQLQESGEMYLETILILSRKKESVRSLDIAEEMGFSKPSVSRAVKLLKDGGFILVDANGYITFTPVGKSTAEKIYERHNVLTEFFKSIGVDPDTASEDACRIEHVISDVSFRAVKDYLDKK